MKKILLAFVFSVALLCGGALVVSAKNTSRTANSVGVSKNLLVVKNIFSKIKTLKARCESDECKQQFEVLDTTNVLYAALCGPEYKVGCAPVVEKQLLDAARDFERCYYRNMAKNTDRKIDRIKFRRFPSRDV